MIKMYDELLMNRTQYGTHLQNMKMVKDNISLVDNADVLVGDNNLEAADKFVSLFEDIKYVIRKYKWLLENDIGALEDIKLTWDTVDSNSASSFCN